MEIAAELRRLRRELNDALWQGDDATELERTIARLEFLQSLGETHDLPF